MIYTYYIYDESYKQPSYYTLLSVSFIVIFNSLSFVSSERSVSKMNRSPRKLFLLAVSTTTPGVVHSAGRLVNKKHILTDEAHILRFVIHRRGPSQRTGERTHVETLLVSLTRLSKRSYVTRRLRGDSRFFSFPNPGMTRRYSNSPSPA